MNAFMPPPPIQPINDSSGGGYKPQPQRQPFQPPYQPGARGFNPSGGLGQVTDQPFPGQFSFPGMVPNGSPPGWMPPPPVQGLDGDNFRMTPQRQPFQPPQLPGWAGYLQWLQMMGGRGPGFMPPPPTQGF